MRSDVKKYVQEMGITDNFFERMFNTDPSEIEIYRGVEKTKKIIPARDPVWDEIDTSENARRYGLTTSEYRKRNSLAIRTCSALVINNLKGLIECMESNLWGISSEDYRSRSGTMLADVPNANSRTAKAAPAR
jgi:hypothetical protein